MRIFPTRWIRLVHVCILVFFSLHALLPFAGSPIDTSRVHGKETSSARSDTPTSSPVSHSSLPTSISDASSSTYPSLSSTVEGDILAGEAQMLLITSDTITPTQLTIDAGTMLLIQNSHDQARDITITPQTDTDNTDTDEPPPPVTSLGDYVVFLPIIARPAIGEAASLTATRTLSSPASSALPPVASTTLTSDAPTATPSAETITLQPYQTRPYLFERSGEYQMSVVDTPALTTRITVQPTHDLLLKTTHGLLTTPQNHTATIDIRDLVFDARGDTLTFSIEEPPQHGTATLDGSQIIYTPTDGFVGDDALLYQVVTSSGHAALNWVDILVTVENTPPMAGGRSIHIAATSPHQFDLTTLARDADGDPLSFSLAHPPTRGDASIVQSTLIYTPTATAPYTDTLVYAATDPSGEQAQNTIGFIVVDVSESENDPPMVDNQSTTMSVSDTYTLDVESLVFEPDGDSVEMSLGYDDGGQARMEGTTLHYTPVVSGIVGLTYYVTDTHGVGSKGHIVVQVVEQDDDPSDLIDRTQPVQMAIEPRTVMLHGAGDSQRFTLHAYNALNEEIAVDDSVIWFAANQDDARSIQMTPDPDDPMVMTATATSDVGFMHLKALWKGIPSSAASIAVTELYEGVVTIPDEALTSMIDFAVPPALAAQPASQWETLLVDEESDLQPHYRVVVDETAIDGSLSVGTLLASGGSNPIFGEVVAATPAPEYGGTEIIYATRPVTKVVKTMQFQATFEPEDLAASGETGPFGTIGNADTHTSGTLNTISSAPTLQRMQHQIAVATASSPLDAAAATTATQEDGSGSSADTALSASEQEQAAVPASGCRFPDRSYEYMAVELDTPTTKVKKGDIIEYTLTIRKIPVPPGDFPPMGYFNYSVNLHRAGEWLLDGRLKSGDLCVLRQPDDALIQSASQ